MNVDRAAIANMSAAELVRTYNQITGKSIKRFSDRKEGAKRVLAALDAAQGAERPAPAAATDQPEPAPAAPAAGRTAGPLAIPAREGGPKLPRPASKRGQLLETLRTPKGISVEEMMERFAWTARDCGDALRLLAKQNGVGVARDAEGRWRTT